MLTLRRYGGTRATSAPSSRTAPPVGCSKPAMMRSVVVFPHPDGPSSEKNSPRPIRRVRSSTAVKPPKRLVTASSSTAHSPVPADEVRCGAHAVRPPVRTARPLSRRPSRRGSSTASAMKNSETRSMSVPTALIVGEMPKRSAE